MVNISQQVDNKGVKASNAIVRNIEIIHPKYKLTNTQRRHGLLSS